MINQRVAEWFLVQKEKGVKQSHLMQEWQLSKQVVSDLVNGKKSIGIERIINILDFDKELHARWLILGEGEMYDKKTNNSKNEKEIIYKKTNEVIFEELKKQIQIKDEQIKFLQNIIEKKL